MSDEWHFSHKNESGHDVNAYGYDKNGVYRGTAPFKNNDNNQPSNRKNRKSKSKAVGGGGLIVLLLIIFIIIKILEFLEKNWVSVVAILSTIILCILFCLIIKRKLAKTGLATFSAIAISIGIIIGIIYLGPIQNDGNFERWGNNNTIVDDDSPSTTVKKAFAVAETSYKTGDWNEFDKYSAYDPNTLHFKGQNIDTMKSFLYTYGGFNKIISELILGDKATVKATFEKGNDCDIKLIRHDGRWKILF